MLTAITKHHRDVYGSEWSLIVRPAKLLTLKRTSNTTSSRELEKLIEFLSRFDNLRPGMVFCWIQQQFVCSAFVLLILCSVFSLYADSRPPARLMPQRLARPSRGHLEFHQDPFADGRERSAILWTSNFDARQHAVSFFAANPPGVQKFSSLSSSRPRPGTASHKLPLMRK
jgi:hypothetical protein